MGTKRNVRKKHYSLPLHKRRVLLSARLSKELREKMKKRSAPIRKGDKVKVMRGDFKGKSGFVASVDYKNAKVKVEGVSNRNSRGVDVLVPLSPSNLMIIEKKLEEKKRA